MTAPKSHLTGEGEALGNRSPTHHRSVTLPSGGSLTFSCVVNLLQLSAVNLLQLSAADRTFLFTLIDSLDAFEAQAKAAQQAAGG